MLFLTENYEFIIIVAQVGVLALLALVAGFFLARWMYRYEAQARNTILSQEIIRLRRKVSESETVQHATSRHHQRLRRQVRSMAQI